MWLIATPDAFSNGLTKAASAAGVHTPPGSATVSVSAANICHGIAAVPTATPQPARNPLRSIEASGNQTRATHGIMSREPTSIQGEAGKPNRPAALYRASAFALSSRLMSEIED